jgi:hypothetical protein
MQCNNNWVVTLNLFQGLLANSQEMLKQLARLCHSGGVQHDIWCGYYYTISIHENLALKKIMRNFSY